MSSQHPSDGQGSRGTRRAIRSAASRLKSALGLPPSIPPSSGHQENWTGPTLGHRNQHIPSPTTPLLDSAPSAELNQPTIMLISPDPPTMVLSSNARVDNLTAGHEPDGAQTSEDGERCPLSSRFSSGNLERMTAPNIGTHTLPISRLMTPLVTPSLSTQLDQMAAAPIPGPYTQISVADAQINNPTGYKQSAISPWDQLTYSLRALENGIEWFPTLKSAVGEMVGCLDLVQKAASNRRDYKELVLELRSMADTLNEYVDELGSEPNGSIANIAQCIQHHVACIEKKKESGMARRLLDASNDEEDVVRRYRELERMFRQIQCDLSMRTRSNARKQVETTLLQNMSPVDDAKYNSGYSTTIRRRGCTAKTREAIHTALQDWTENPGSEKIYWMNGMAGTGKTTIAYSFCEWLKGANRLGASFFCSRISSPCRSLNQIIPTIAYQLARFSPAFRSKLCAVLNEDPDVGKLNVEQQFQSLIYHPILLAKDAMPDIVVIVIDALDECDDIYSVRLLLDVLLKFAEELSLKFFVASRPEHFIRDRMISRRGSSRLIVHLHDIEQSIVEEDIKKYLTEALGSMESPPSLEQIKLLAKRSRNLFIYAATIIRYIYPDVISVDSTARLERILEAIDTTNGTSDNRYQDLDLLYTTVLSAVFKSSLGDDEKDYIRRVLSTVVCAREPITQADIATLANLDERQVSSGLQSLRSVVYVPEESSLISTLHASFPEYMLDKSRSKEFCCYGSVSNEIMAHSCLTVMKSKLSFNICVLNNSYTTDDKVQDLEDRVTRFIPTTLSYACRYWGSHLALAPATSNMRAMLLDFLSHQLLFWMEVLSLNRCIGIGAPILQQAQTWLQQVENDQDEIQKQVSDARNFVTCPTPLR
ncbi:unnamed protein product [Rhizoctonia solani]|uniref:Nephrocystin 3-like N-terminal domain-containing protein n=1 Tax=Rhizoctonia solani TaxID=456999 RepID=A0A8H3EBF8_9AGAM|nr:unnamed protein product [Rhizoctonia solani]